MVARCTEGDMEWLLGTWRVHRSVADLRGVLEMCTSWVQIISISWFLGKFGKIICWCPHLREILDLPLQMGIEWLLGVQRGTWSGLLGALKVCRGHMEGYRMVAMCTEGDMEWLRGVPRGIEWLLGVQRWTWNGCYVHGGCTEGYRMVARCVEGHMEWFLGAQRGIDWLLGVHRGT